MPSRTEDDTVLNQDSATTKATARFSAMALCLLAIAAGPLLAQAQKGEQLSGSALKAFISGKRIYLATPLGGEIPLYYRANGVVDGSGEAVGLGRYLAPKDRGRWWISKDRVCQKWKEWYDGRTFCFTLARLSSTAVYWKRDDGGQGTARIAK